MDCVRLFRPVVLKIGVEVYLCQSNHVIDVVYSELLQFYSKYSLF